MRYLFSIVVFCLLPAAVFSDTIYVPDDQSTIQGAIDAAVSGVDVVIVRSGTYVENINFNGKAITLQSESGPETTIIDGGGVLQVVQFNSGEGLDSIIDGFTITNGFAKSNVWIDTSGAGIWCVGSSPTIRNNIITGNLSQYFGGGIACTSNYASPLITNNDIIDNDAHTGAGIVVRDYSFPEISFNNISYNTARGTGGGVCNYGYGSLTNNIIANNTAAGSGGIQFSSSTCNCFNNLVIYNTATNAGHVGGISCSCPYNSYANYRISNCIVARNTGKGISISWGHNGNGSLITNCTVVHNTTWGITSSPHTEVWNSIVWWNTDGQVPTDAQIKFYYGNLEGGWPWAHHPGNIDVDPAFVDAANDDFQITSSSPCIDVGDNGSPFILTTDYDGDPRIWDGDNNGTPTVDMGADEFHSPDLVELVSFDAAGRWGVVSVQWETASEIDTAGFHIWRSWKRSPAEIDFVRITRHLIPAEGGPSQGATYLHEDSYVFSGHPYCYRLEDVNLQGEGTFHEPAVVRWRKPRLDRH